MIYSFRERRQNGPPFLPLRLGCALVLCILFNATALFAQESAPQKISPDEAVELAIKNNLGLESERISLNTKKRKSDHVWNQFLPSVSASGTLNRANEESKGMTLPFPPALGGPVTMGASPQWAVVGNLSATLDFSFALIEGIRSVRLDYETGQLTFEKARLQMERDVRKSYNQILLLEANMALLRDSFSNAERQAAVAEANYREGRAPRLTWLQAQVQVENMKPNISDLENGLKAAQAQFAMTLGLPYDTRFELQALDGKSLDIPLDTMEFISRASSGKPDIQELQKQVQTLQSQRKAMALQMYTPFLRLSWGLSPTFAGDPWKDSWFEGDNWTDRGSFSVTLGMNFNGLFSFTKEGQQLKDLDNTLRNLNIGLTRTVQATELEIFTKVNSLEKTRVSAGAQNAAVDLAEQSYRLTEEAYRAGMQDLQAVQNAALQLNQAKLQQLTLQFNFLSDLIDLEYAIGAPFGTLMGRN